MVKGQVQQDDANRNGTNIINFTLCRADPTRLLTEPIGRRPRGSMASGG